ncbi:methyltransferase domain-containing protein, partial [Desulfovibrio sp.]
MNALWERPDFRRAAGDAWRPGGVELTRRALAWCASAGLLAPGGLVLDLGSGAGATLRLLSQMGYRAVGLDKHAEAGLPVDAAPSADVRIVRADLERPPLAADSCDCIVCECVLSL